MNTWKCVKDSGKPPKSGRYLVFADRCHVFITQYDPERGADFDENISHWMELPPKPSYTEEYKTLTPEEKQQ